MVEYNGGGIAEKQPVVGKRKVIAVVWLLVTLHGQRAPGILGCIGYRVRVKL
jgi:hypothetical protein